MSKIRNWPMFYVGLATLIVVCVFVPQWKLSWEYVGRAVILGVLAVVIMVDAVNRELLGHLLGIMTFWRPRIISYRALDEMGPLREGACQQCGIDLNRGTTYTALLWEKERLTRQGIEVLETRVVVKLCMKCVKQYDFVSFLQVLSKRDGSFRLVSTFTRGDYNRCAECDRKFDQPFEALILNIERQGTSAGRNVTVKDSGVPVTQDEMAELRMGILEST